MRIWLALLCVLAAMATGCPKRTRSVRGPAEASAPTTGDASARTRFQEARARFERDGERPTPTEFEQIAEEYPNDPIAPFALLYAGRAALANGEFERAAQILGAVESRPDVDAALRDRARLFLGVAHGYLGDYERAVALLEPSNAAVDDRERGERLAVLAEAYVALSRGPDALRYYDAWFGVATEPERAYVLARVRALVDAAPPEQLLSLYESFDDEPTPSRLALAEAIAGAATDVQVAAAYRAAANDLRRSLGLEPIRAGLGRGGDPGLLGAALPLSGRRGRVGEAAMRGLALAAGTFDGGAAGPSPFTVAVRDSESSAQGAGASVARLIADGVIAVVGPVTASASREAGRRAAEVGLPLVSLDPTGGADATGLEHGIYYIVLPPEARARALARHAARRGIKRVAILGPELDYGRRVGAAFAAEMRDLGGTVITEAYYDPKTTSFGPVIDQIRGKPWDAVFIPDTARRLELVAPALAAANLQVRPLGARDPQHGRKIALLSTAEALTPRYIRGSARYSHGAVLAPGFYADQDDPRIGDFVTRYQAAFGRAPNYLDAYAYDAARVVRTTIERGARSRAEVDAAISGTTVPGLTGEVAFGGARRRADDGLLFVVTQDAGGEYRIRAQR